MVWGTEPDSGFLPSIGVTWNSNQPLGVTVVFRPRPFVGLIRVGGHFWSQASFIWFLPNQIHPILVNWVLEAKPRSPLLKFIRLALACQPNSLLFSLCCFYIKTVDVRAWAKELISSLNWIQETGVWSESSWNQQRDLFKALASSRDWLRAWETRDALTEFHGFHFIIFSCKWPSSMFKCPQNGHLPVLPFFSLGFLSFSFEKRQRQDYQHCNVSFINANC